MTMENKPLWVLTNKVVNGVRRGRKIGFPTANIDFPGDQDWNEVHYGVYAVKVSLDHKNYLGVANMGIPLTFNESKPRIDIHFFDFSGNIYGKLITVEFWEKIRDVKRFHNEQELVWQIEDDIDFVKKYFKKNLEPKHDSK